MRFIKSKDGEQISAFNDSNELVAYIRKNRMGTHGHWNGWRHYLYCDYLNQYIWAGVNCTAVYPGWNGSGYGFLDHWTNAPTCFSNITEFKNYYR